MRIFALSDIHVDFGENRKWLRNLSETDFTNDVLILAGDVSHRPAELASALQSLEKRFLEVCFVPGNHDLWVKNEPIHSLDKFKQVLGIAGDLGVRTGPYRINGVSIIPLFGWYDYTFGRPNPGLIRGWTDFSACRWPEGFDESAVTRHFLSLNPPNPETNGEKVISFSHFMPRIDLMPSFIPKSRRILYPVLGTVELEKRIRSLGAKIHVYGHSHVNRRVRKNGILYVNNALGYPHETRIAARKLVCVHQYKGI